MIEARFVGGVLDGQTKRMVGARYYEALVNVDNVGHADDVNWISLDAKGMPIPRPLKVETQRYVRREIRNADGRIVEFVYELEPNA